MSIPDLCQGKYAHVYFLAKTTNEEKLTRIANCLAPTLATLGLCFSLNTPLQLLSMAGAAWTARKVLSIGFGYLLIPSTQKAFYPLNHANEQPQVDEDRKHDRLTRCGYTITTLTLEKSGVTYRAHLIYQEAFKTNRQWTLHLVQQDNFSKFVETAKEDTLYKSNTLLLYTSSAYSNSVPTKYQLGAGIEAGFQYLEQRIRAKKIFVKSNFLCSGMMAEAILQHDFSFAKSKCIDYLFLFDRTFSRLSEVATFSMHPLAQVLYHFCELDLEPDSAIIKLSELNFPHIVVQRKDLSIPGNAGILPYTHSLAGKLHTFQNEKKRTFLEGEGIEQGSPLPPLIQASLEKRLQTFFTLR